MGRGRGSIDPKMDAIIKSARGVGVFILHVLQAVVGTAIIESPLHAIYHPHVRSGIIIKEDLLSATVAFASGCLVYNKWRQAAPKWVWLAGVCWFGIHLFLVSDGEAAVVEQLAGTGCLSNVGSVACNDWSTATLPLLRTLFYSAGAFLCAHVIERGRKEGSKGTA
jgi:hypothetical protein